MKKRNGAKRWPLGFGILYLMVHIPFPLVWKIGITGVGVGKRAKSIDDEMPGFPFPVAFVIVPFCYTIEQALHDLCKPIQCDFYRGSGHSEWFWFPCVVPALAVITSVWVGYMAAIDWYFGTTFLNLSFMLIIQLFK